MTEEPMHLEKRTTIGPVHEELLHIVEREPGLSPKEIRDRARLSAGLQLSGALVDLCERSLVTYEDDGYYPIKQNTESNNMKVKLKGASQLKIFNAIPDGGCFVEHIEKETGLGKANIQAQIVHLKRKGLVNSDLVSVDGRERAFYTRLESAPASPLNQQSSKPAKPPHKKPAGNGETPDGTTGKAKRDDLSKSHIVGGDAVEGILERAVEQAQDNLDDYLASVADPEILAALKQQRDAARKSLTDYRARVGE